MTLLNRLDEEIRKARFRKDTTMMARLQESQREIELLRWAVNEIAGVEDSSKAQSLRDFVLPRKKTKIKDGATK